MAARSALGAHAAATAWADGAAWRPDQAVAVANAVDAAMTSSRTAPAAARHSANGYAPRAHRRDRGDAADSGTRVFGSTKTTGTCM